MQPFTYYTLRFLGKNSCDGLVASYYFLEVCRSDSLAHKDLSLSHDSTSSWGSSADPYPDRASSLNYLDQCISRSSTHCAPSLPLLFVVILLSFDNLHAHLLASASAQVQVLYLYHVLCSFFSIFKYLKFGLSIYSIHEDFNRI